VRLISLLAPLAREAGACGRRSKLRALLWGWRVDWLHPLDPCILMTLKVQPSPAHAPVRVHKRCPGTCIRCGEHIARPADGCACQRLPLRVLHMCVCARGCARVCVYMYVCVQACVRVHVCIYGPRLDALWLHVKTCRLGAPPQQDSSIQRTQTHAHLAHADRQPLQLRVSSRREVSRPSSARSRCTAVGASSSCCLLVHACCVRVCVRACVRACMSVLKCGRDMSMGASGWPASPPAHVVHDTQHTNYGAPDLARRGAGSWCAIQKLSARGPGPPSARTSSPSSLDLLQPSTRK